jgi:hypothetical protein
VISCTGATFSKLREFFLIDKTVFLSFRRVLGPIYVWYCNKLYKDIFVCFIMILARKLLVSGMVLAMYGCGTEPNNPDYNGNNNFNGSGNLNNNVNDNSSGEDNSLLADVYEGTGHSRGDDFGDSLRDIAFAGFGCAMSLSREHGDLGRGMAGDVCDVFCSEVRDSSSWTGVEESICRNIADENYGVCQEGDFCESSEPGRDYCRATPLGDRDARDFFTFTDFEDLGGYLESRSRSLDQDLGCDGAVPVLLGAGCSVYFEDVPVDVERVFDSCRNLCEFQRYNSNWSDAAVEVCVDSARASYQTCLADRMDCSQIN